MLIHTRLLHSHASVVTATQTVSDLCCWVPLHTHHRIFVRGECFDSSLTTASASCISAIAAGQLPMIPDLQ